MKKNLAKILAALLALIFVISAVSCGKTVKEEPDTQNTAEPAESATQTEVSDPLWKKAEYMEDTTFGTGEKTVQVEVKAGEKSVTFTLKTNDKTLGDALLAHKLVAGETSQYGLYVKVVNGITADYDVDQSYWAFYKNGEYMMTGIDGTDIADGEHYELVYTK